MHWQGQSACAFSAVRRAVLVALDAHPLKWAQKHTQGGRCSWSRVNRKY